MSFYDDEYNQKNKESKKAEKQRRDREISDLQKILRIPEGRRLIWRIWTIAGIFRNPFNPNSNQHSFNSGQMSIGQDLLADVNEADTFAFAKIQQEFVSEAKSKKQLKQEEIDG
jgi:hypothetical protein